MVDYLDYPELIRAIKNTKFIENTDGRGDQFHPQKTPIVYAEPINDTHAIRLFSELVRNINEPDYGDFMRRANSYLCNLKSQLKNAGRSIQKKIEEMQHYTQFSPNWNVESTRTLLLKDAEILKRWIENSQLTKRPPAKPERKSVTKQKNFQQVA